MAGRQVAGELVRHAAERHLRDLKDGAARGLHWRPEHAQHALEFFPAILTVTAGAKAGQPFDPLWWHTFVLGSLYGWRRADGRRRFRSAWLETGKGQAKSPLMAAIGIYELGFRGQARAEIYAISSDKNQANVLFQDAVAMCRAAIPDRDGETLESTGAVVLRGTGDMSWKIEHPASGSKFQALATTDAISGPRPTLVLADEIHEFKSEHALELWNAAIVKMPGDPLMLLGTNTPAAGQIVGTDYSEQYQRVARGDFHDDTSFAFIARTDPGDDPINDESCWPKSLPALGITYPAENLRGEVAKARLMPGTMLSLKRLYFGIPVGSSAPWIDEAAWESCQGEVDPEPMKDWPCYLGMDLSQRNDLTALAAVWRRPTDGHLFARVTYWKPRDTLLASVANDKAPYDKWAETGDLLTVPGSTIGKGYVAAEVQQVAAQHHVETLAFDPAHILDFMAEASTLGFAVWEWKGEGEPAGAGVKMVRHAQGARGMHSERMLWMPRSVQCFEDRVLDGSITIDRTGLTTWCSANATLLSDPSGNRYFDKKRSRGRIDGIVALAMAIGAADATPVAAGASIWDNPALAALLV